MSRIEDYGLIGDLHTAALIDRAGSIDWLCVPHFDSPACFAALLGDETAGSWWIRPVRAQTCTRRRYVDDTLVLQTEWDTPTGSIRVTDFMPVRDQNTDLIRIVEGLRGRVEVETQLRVRPAYGETVPWVRHHTADGRTTVHAVAGPDALWVDAPVVMHGVDLSSRATFSVAAGQRLPFVLRHAPSYAPEPRRPDPEQALAATLAHWQRWMTSYSLDLDAHPAWDSAVRRSLLLLKALTYAPTGGIVAAATTSLPEQLGGPRNWDYRYCWLRDATFTLQALLGTGFIAEAKAWREWLLRAVAGDPADLQIMYALDGTRRLPEITLDWLPGFENSRPVRVGNAAAGQFQLDVWGEVLDGLHLARTSGLDPQLAAWDVQRALLDYLEGHWHEPDNSLWEMRGDRRPFVHSKVLAWAGVDRAVQAVERFGLDGPVDRWRRVRDDIHRDVTEHGYDTDRGTFTQFYGSKGLDAALLLIPAVGFLPANDPRVHGTVDAVRRELDHHGLLLRYDPSADGGVDGLPGTEGAFLACTFWLVDALHATGRTEEARALFERLLGLRNDLGLLSEEYDPLADRQLGNTPQAFSLVGLVNSARQLGGSQGADLHLRTSSSDNP